MNIKERTFGDQPASILETGFSIPIFKEELIMRNFSIDIIWAKIQMAIAALGGWLGYFLGGMDGLMIALIIFMALDYITGLMCAVIDKKLSSAVGFKGICKKVLILMLVGVAHIIDLHVVGTQRLTDDEHHVDAVSATCRLSAEGRTLVCHDALVAKIFV